MKTSQFTTLIRHWVEARLRGKQGNGSAQALAKLLDSLTPRPVLDEEEYGDETSSYGGWPAPW